ncbi:MAG: Lhr-like helicase [Myxococcota bacterium]
MDIKTGDSPRLRVGDRPLVVITTPESLDSMMCRRTQALRGVRAIVLDELHLFHRTARGDQLRCLLAGSLGLGCQCAPTLRRIGNGAQAGRPSHRVLPFGRDLVLAAE